MIVGDSDIIAFDRCQKVQFRLAFELFLDFTWRKPFVGDDDSLTDIVVPDKCVIGIGINAVSQAYLGTNGFHCLYVVGINDGYLLTAFYPDFVGEFRQVIYSAGVLFQHPIDCDMIFLCYC